MANDTPTTNTAACEDVCSLPKSDEELRKLLTPEQYRIVRQNGTERPFANAYWDNKREGIYVDIVDSTPLFSSKDKFDSGTGWPSFTKPLAEGAVVDKVDNSHGMRRTEVRSAKADSHLGHVFDDGPAPTGLRYCINSGALRFIPTAKLEEEGFGHLLPHFGKVPAAKAPGGDDALPAAKTETAMFGAGCFWGVESTFRKIPGVLDTAVGYSGGTTENPTYKEVCTGRTGHAEVVHITFDPTKVTYQQLLEKFFELHDPTQLNRQGPDYGTQYRTAVFAYSPVQRAAAEKTIKALDGAGKFRRPIVTKVEEASTFYRAEEYHQRYLEKNGLEVCH